MELLRLHEPAAQSHDRLRLAQAKGFDVAQSCREAIGEALDRLARHSGGHNDEPQKAFGQLYANLNRLYLDEAGFDPFRRLLRDCILAHWPVAAGEVVLGEALPKRRLHSVLTAAREAGITTDLARQFLLEAGAIRPEDDRPDGRKTFDADRFAPLIAEIPTLIGPGPMRRAMGATLKEFQALVADGVLLPRTLVPTIKSPRRLAGGGTLVAELQAHAVPVAADDAAWESIQRARQRRGLAVGAVIVAIQAGELQAGRRAGVEGYGGIVVARAEVDRLAEERSVRLTPGAAVGRGVWPEYRDARWRPVPRADRRGTHSGDQSYASEIRHRDPRPLRSRHRRVPSPVRDHDDSRRRMGRAPEHCRRPAGGSPECRESRRTGPITGRSICERTWSRSQDDALGRETFVAGPEGLEPSACRLEVRSLAFDITRYHP
ncbi:hypothetical protein LAZ40_02685 [Cereibacter sphaeroides]|uniref:hypothetical protein n=1 Tax=Cereibacter sphaeroides TaxID=1063 RepID=UPI001F324642|nr:hypothetical protein [Cereibacter sphaeroides]MCE6957963.1 hypothetical protein [Cereibacter sphaeroides]MCE6971770.1 hypothetical protein [Cereibacter sphaeroides]